MDLKIYLRLEGEQAELFRRIKKHYGLKNDTEVIRFLIGQCYRQNKEALEPKLKYLTFNSEGAMILDRNLDSVVQVHLNPEGTWCDHCKTEDCLHTKFALTHPENRKH